MAYENIPAVGNTAAGGDLSGFLPSPTVATVGGSTAANIATAEALANAATDANTVSTIVKRDGSGNFSAGTITAATGIVLSAGTIAVPATITTGGTTGNQTINKISGTVNIAAAGTTVTVTNSLVTANSIVLAVIRTDDATAVIKNVVPSSGSFIINLEAAATAETSVGFFVVS